MCPVIAIVSSCELLFSSNTKKTRHYVGNTYYFLKIPNHAPIKNYTEYRSVKHLISSNDVPCKNPFIITLTAAGLLAKVNSFFWRVVSVPQVWPIQYSSFELIKFSLRGRCSDLYKFTRAAYITSVGLWLPISLDSFLYCENIKKPKLIYTVLMRFKIRPKRASALN